MKVLERESLREAELNIAEARQLHEILQGVTTKVRPPRFMVSFYNFMGKLPMKLGTLIFLLTGIDTLRVALRASRNRTDAAIQVLYQYEFRPWRLIWGVGDHLWQSAYNCRSVRARGQFALKVIKLFLSIKRAKTIVSLGSGSANQLLQAVATNGDCNLILVDNNLQALERGEKNARRLGIKNSDFCKATIGHFLKGTHNSFDLIEMIGLADYFPEKKLSQYFIEIEKKLNEKGVFIGANISSNEEASYAHGVACWPKMYYRSREQLLRLLLGAGFKKENIWTGPCGLYTVWVAQKNFQHPH